MDVYIKACCAEIGSLSSLVDVYREIYKTYKDTTAPFDETSVREFIKNTITSANADILICERDGEIVGICTFFIFSPFFNKHINHSTIFTLWVDPLLRKEGIGRALLDECSRISKERGCTSILAGIHQSDEGTSSYFINKGYRVMDNVYIREIV